MNARTILITGGSGFLGQHIVKQLQEKDESVTEIRIVDQKPFVNLLGFKEKIPIKSYIVDITGHNNTLDEAFSSVSCVFHCAALVSYEFPSDDKNLYKVNVEGTRNVIEQCLKHGINVLIYTSTTEVCIKPYFKNGFFSLVVNQTENKATPPEDHTQFIFGTYSRTKLEAEKLVLEANNSLHVGCKGILKTIALRPTLMYGEGDTNLIPSLLIMENMLNQNICSITGAGGRQQLAYAGNVAWAHICAKNKMMNTPDDIAGLPVFIADDTQIDDVLYFCKKISIGTGKPVTTYKAKMCYVPPVLTFLISVGIEFVYKKMFEMLNCKRISVSPKSIIIFLNSILYFNCMRASIYLDYSPIYKSSDSFKLSSQYYNSFNKSKICTTKV